MADRRRELAQKLFGLQDSPQGSSETQIKMAARISEAILCDLVQHCQKSWAEEGDGVLIIRRLTDDVIWSTAADIKGQLALAERFGDTEFAGVFRDILSQLANLDIESEGLIAIADSRGLRLLRLPLHGAADSIQSLLEAWND
jgi:hypothetical protein